MSPLLLLLASCTTTSTTSKAPEPGAALLDSVPIQAEVELLGLSCPVQVLRVEADIPHIYAHNEADLARVLGYVYARDRYFTLDLARRLGQGEVSGILGDDALATDMASRNTGMLRVTERLLERMSGDQAALFDAYAEGLNAWIAAVQAGREPLPSELELAGPLLGAEDPSVLMVPFDRRDLAAVAAVLVYELGFETGDVGRMESWLAIQEAYAADEPMAELKQEGLLVDIWGEIRPIHAVASGPQVGEASSARVRRAGHPRGPGVERGLLHRSSARLRAWEERLGHRRDEGGWGSNAWAVSDQASATGGTLVEGDGHLPLSVPALFYQAGLDTRELGGGEVHQVGLLLPGLPFIAVGTNGLVAWSQTQLGGDITDWYAEQLLLDSEGRPASVLHQGEQVALIAVEEAYEVADVPLLGSVGRSELWTRYETWDGRMITDVEGLEVEAGATAEAGQTVLALMGAYVIPMDMDGDGIISAISFDYTGLDVGDVLGAVMGFGRSQSVDEFLAHTRGLVAYSQNLVAGDLEGGLLYSPYQAMPCRDELEREREGTWAEGADPGLLLDGTRYAGFSIPLDAQGYVDEAGGCVVPHAEFPGLSLRPAEGWVMTANNDPAGHSFDNSLTNDGWYVGGPWNEGYRADSISGRLAELVASGEADVNAMAELQAERHSRTGLDFSSVLLEGLAAGRLAALTGGADGSSEARLAELYSADSAALDEVSTRVEAWLAAGCPTPSGVPTFYSSAEGEEDDAVATMIFNAWLPRYVALTLDDEGWPHVWRPGSASGHMRALRRLVLGRGPDNPLGLASWSAETGESAFYDLRGTPEIESSEEIALLALVDALEFLRSAPDEEANGGFGHSDMSGWLWGLRHRVEFKSVLADFVTDPTYAFITDQFSITTDRLPLGSPADWEEATEDILGYPRPGDNFAVDDADPGFTGTDFDYSTGPSFRMVIQLGPDRVTGQNILPGGQSALTDSEHFDDQVQRWLANEALPLRFHLDDVVAGAAGRERYAPPGAPAGTTECMDNPR